MTFADELDEKESLIEFNKQRVKTPSQIYRESTTLRSIYAERARLRKIEAGKLYGEGHPKEQEVPVNLREPLENTGRKENETVHKLVEATGVKETKLETILDIGELAEKGKILSAKERASEADTLQDTNKTEKVNYIIY
jgi:hypothetical protein